MSRLALLVGAVPKRCTEGPIVRLLPGVWTLRIEGLIDSKLGLDPHESISNGLQVNVITPTDVQLHFVKRGTEPFINVFAEKQ